MTRFTRGRFMRMIFNRFGHPYQVVALFTRHFVDITRYWDHVAENPQTTNRWQMVPLKPSGEDDRNALGPTAPCVTPAILPPKLMAASAAGYSSGRQ